MKYKEPLLTLGAFLCGVALGVFLGWHLALHDTAPTEAMVTRAFSCPPPPTMPLTPSFLFEHEEQYRSLNIYVTTEISDGMQSWLRNSPVPLTIPSLCALFQLPGVEYIATDVYTIRIRYGQAFAAQDVRSTVLQILTPYFGQGVWIGHAQQAQ